ncbi:MAG: Zn-ribbon domain-containing OB-fold protein [Chloroflexi bacterium]|nr:Zn-ribbon domain-containing OB-fold protein [Chloroflexota bacterium]MDA0241884.1 Zn-ribbon domain-containing OB-fold protein [Chloroflexota bacterium]
MTVSRHWRMNAQRYNIIGGMGQDAVKVLQHSGQFPQEATAEQDYIFTGQGEVYSYTTVYDAPAGFERYAPYVLALVKLAEGPLVTAQLTDVMPEQVQIGMPVEMVTRKLRTEGEEGMIVYGYKFRPTLMGVSA